MTEPMFAFSHRARHAADQPISYLMAEALANPGLISLAAGFVDYETLPTEATRSLLDGLLADPAAARAALQYGTTAGLPALRERLYRHLATLDDAVPDGYPGSPDDLVVTTGSQQLLHLLTDLLVDPGDIVVTAWPSYFVYSGALSAFGAQVRSVDSDEHGMIPQRLESLLAELDAAGQLNRVKLVYVCSYHENPTGRTLSAERRPRIVEIVRRFSRDHRILILEDAAYRELKFDGTAPPSMKRFDPGNEFVALLQTFSKPFAPGLKTGYGLLPRELVEPLCLQKGGRDFGSANLCQHLLERAMTSGAFTSHIERLRQAYAVKRDAMLAALEEHLGDFEPRHTSWTRPRGGLYVWLTLPPHIDTGRHSPLFTRSLELGVLFVPGEYCYPPDETRQPSRHTIRLSFGVPSVEQIERGIARLAEALRQVV